MPVTRRGVLGSLGAAGLGGFSATMVSARGREAFEAGETHGAGVGPAAGAEIHIDSNENPMGPGHTALEGLVRAFADAGRYPTNSRPSMADLREAVARKLAVRPENVALGAGSSELLRNAVRYFTSPSRHLVVASPTFELPERLAERLGTPVRRVVVDAAGRLDLDKMAEAARWAGLVYIANPNNPTATVQSAKAVAEFVGRVRKESPETAILLDEAYHDYVTDHAYGTALSLALEHPGVVVARTFSKAYGMAGLRVGYAVGQSRTMEALSRWAMPYGPNALGLAAAVASLGDTAHIESERARNTEVRDFTSRFFRAAGHKVMDSQANFLMVDLGRPSKAFREACKERGVFVGREFAPLDKTHTRVSLGTMEEMRRAVEVFGAVLGGVAAGAGAAGAR